MKSPFLVPFVLLLACPKPSPSPEPSPSPPLAVTAELVTCAASYTVDAVISGTDLAEQINNVTFTDDSPFTCSLGSSTSTTSFQFVATTTAASCTYDMTYYVDGPSTSCPSPTGTTFSGTQTLSCSQPELDFVAVAVPQSTDPDCRGKARLCDDPKIKLNTDNCG